MLTIWRSRLHCTSQTKPGDWHEPAEPRCPPYTQALLASVPVADPRSKRFKPLVDGDVPSPSNPPNGCAFHTRCHFAIDRCRLERPLLRDAADGHHQVACLLNEGTGRSS